MGVIIWKDRKILIGRRRKSASHGALEYCFPGGHMEGGESFEESARRETLEESGIKIKNIKFLCVANIKMYQVVLICLSADWDRGEPRSFPKENIGEWQWRDIDDLPKPLFYPTKITVDSCKTGKKYYNKK